MKKPILISIPHGGQLVPEELAARTILSPQDILADSDPFTDIIYDINRQGFTVIKAEIARAFVDLNRAPDDFPPNNPDGVIKSHTCYNIPVYPEGRIPKGDLLKKILSRYYDPYHKRIEAVCQQKEILMGLDCHSMASSPPPISTDPKEKRPPICLGNVYGGSCNKHIVQKLAESLSLGFSIPESDIAINRPFSGGYITQKYGNNPIPWIQIELNRDFYLRQPWFQEDPFQMTENRLHVLNKMFDKSIKHFLSDGIIDLIKTPVIKR